MKLAVSYFNGWFSFPSPFGSCGFSISIKRTMSRFCWRDFLYLSSFTVESIDVSYTCTQLIKCWKFWYVLVVYDTGISDVFCRPENSKKSLLTWWAAQGSRIRPECRPTTCTKVDFRSMRYAVGTMRFWFRANVPSGLWFTSSFSGPNFKQQKIWINVANEEILCATDAPSEKLNLNRVFWTFQKRWESVKFRYYILLCMRLFK